MDVDEEDGGPPRRGGRVRAAPERHRPQRDVECGPTGRPAADERRRANELIDVMLHLKMLRGKAVAVTTNVIALAMAWREDRATFDAVGDHDSNVLFGLPPRSETRRDWVDDVQRRLAQAQEWLALSGQARLNFRPTLWTAAAVAEHRKQGVHVPVPFLARVAIVEDPEQRRDEQKQKQAVPSEAHASDVGRAARPRHRRQACGVGTSVSRCWGSSSSCCCTSCTPPPPPSPLRMRVCCRGVGCVQRPHRLLRLHRRRHWRALRSAGHRRRTTRAPLARRALRPQRYVGSGVPHRRARQQVPASM